MKFSELKFDKTGCCGTHTWAEVRHDSGLLTRIYVEDVGFSASTHAGDLLIKAQAPIADEAAVEARLAADAEI